MDGFLIPAGTPVMPRHPDTLFENEIAADKARLEAEVAGLEYGPKKHQLLKRIRLRISLMVSNDFTRW